MLELLVTVCRQNIQTWLLLLMTADTRTHTAQSHLQHHLPTLKSGVPEYLSDEESCKHLIQQCVYVNTKSFVYLVLMALFVCMYDQLCQ